MNNYVIITDSACDIKPSVLEEWGIKYATLSFRFSDDNVEHADYSMDINEFYSRMRNGGIAKTAAVNPDDALRVMEEELKAGNDVLYIGFSTGLSTTYNAFRIASEELKTKYPERKIYTVDSLAASAGEGLLLYLISRKKKEGATIEESAEYAVSIRLNICHWFTVDDLVYLKRGGRVSPTVAFVGNMLGIKPVMHVDNEGHLINVSKVRGRKNALAALADKYASDAINKGPGDTIFISHSDCLEDANTLAAMIKEKTGADVSIITDVGAVIGAHSGPGTMALFFVGKER